MILQNTVDGLKVLANKSQNFAFYQNRISAENDLNNLNEGTIVAVEDDAGTVDISQYIQDQVELSDYESFSIPENQSSSQPSNPTTVEAPFDGFITITYTAYAGGMFRRKLMINNTEAGSIILYGQGSTSSHTYPMTTVSTFSVKKGDKIYSWYLYGDGASGGDYYPKARWYKKRDYSKR